MLMRQEPIGGAAMQHGIGGVKYGRVLVPEPVEIVTNHLGFRLSSASIFDIADVMGL